MLLSLLSKGIKCEAIVGHVVDALAARKQPFCIILSSCSVSPRALSYDVKLAKSDLKALLLYTDEFQEEGCDDLLG